jgi:hypothetical protein
MPKNMNTTTRKVRLQKAKDGVQKHFANVSSLTIGGQTMTPTALTQSIQDELDRMVAIAKAKAALKVLLDAEQNARPDSDFLLGSLRSYVAGMFGDNASASSMLEDFGFAPRKRTKRTVATKSEALGKAMATREARHTKGPKAKLAIKGGSAPAANAAPVTPATPKA